MKQFLAVVAGVVLSIGASPSQASAQILVFGDNEIFYNNFENLFDANGTVKAPDQTPVVGDHVAGIVNVQFIDANGTTHWAEVVDGQLSGVFAQQVVEVKNDPITGLLHLTLGNPVQTIFTDGAGDTFNTGLASGEMFRFYHQEPATTPFESNGTMLDDVTKATDGTLFASFGLDATNGAGPNGLFGDSDDTGYVYSHRLVSADTEGLAFGALNIVANNTGYGNFRLLNDSNESEIGGTTLGNQLVFASTFELNSNTQSPWFFASNDPARINPVPELSSLWLLGMGLSSFGFVSKKRGLSSAP